MHEDNGNDFNFESPEDDQPITPEAFDGAGLGIVVNKGQLAKIAGIALTTIDRAVADGAPVESRGPRRLGWRINTARFFDWYWRRRVGELTGTSDAMSLETAKRRDKVAQARLRELAVAEREQSLINVDEVCRVVGETFGVVRSRFLAIESQVVGLTDDQREQLKAAIADALVDVSGMKREDWIEGDASANVDDALEAEFEFNPEEEFENPEELAAGDDADDGGGEDDFTFESSSGDDDGK